MTIFGMVLRKTHYGYVCVYHTCGVFCLRFGSTTTPKPHHLPDHVRNAPVVQLRTNPG